MKTLLDDRFAPITYSWGFLDAPFQRVVDETVSWQKSIFLRVETLALEGSLSGCLVHLEPLITPPRKKLLLRTKSNWVPYFDNGVNGGDPSSFVGYMSERLRCRGLAVTCIPNTAVRFELYSPEKRDWLNLERSIAAVNDYGKWTFRTTGSVQPFEKTEQYKAKAVKDRFTAELSEEYCAALGIRLSDQDFYGPTGLLINICDPLPSSSIPISLAEARKRIGLDNGT